MKPITLFFLVVIASAACKDDNKDINKEVPEPDKTFAQNAAYANTAEIHISSPIAVITRM